MCGIIHWKNCIKTGTRTYSVPFLGRFDEMYQVPLSSIPKRSSLQLMQSRLAGGVSTAVNRSPFGLSRASAPTGGTKDEAFLQDNPFIRRLTALAPMSGPEITLLQRVSRLTRSYAANAQLAATEDAQYPRVLLSGWACSQHVLRSGRRQIIRFLVPGDIIGSMDRPVAPMVSHVVALTPVLVADARHLWDAINASEEPTPGLVMAVHRALYADAMGLRDQVVRLGGRAAYERLVHLVLELHERLGAVGLVAGNSFAMPTTQEMLADALGMSFVHTNRTLQQIKQDGLLSMRNGQVTIHDMDRMCATADRQAF